MRLIEIIKRIIVRGKVFGSVLERIYFLPIVIYIQPKTVVKSMDYEFV